MILLRSKMLSPLYRFAALLLTFFLLTLFPSSASCQTDAASSVQSLFLQGQQLASQGRLAEAETALLQAKALAPKDITLLTLLAKVQGRLGEHTEAVTLFRQVLKMDPKSPENHLNLAIALADAGQLPAALEETAAAVALAPRSAAAHLNRARVLADLHRIAEARAEFSAANRLQPNNADTLYYWARLEHDDNHLAKETELLQQLIQLQPDSDRDFFLLGRSLSEQSRHQESIAALRRAVELNPHAGEALYMLAMEVKREDPAEGRSLMQRFLHVRDEEAKLDATKTLGNRAYTASQRQDWPEAIRLLRQALSSCDGCTIAAGLHRNLGLALCQSGDIAAGRAELQTALDLDPDDRDAAAALRLLSK